MDATNRIALLVVLAGLLLTFAPNPVPASDSPCPDRTTLQQGAEKIFPQGTIIQEISPGPVPGLCQVQVLFQGQKRILYSDRSGKYFILGQVIDVEARANLTRTATEEANRLTPEELDRLKGWTAFESGTGSNYVYIVTDPQCPYCRQAEERLEELGRQGRMRARYILFPLPSHKGAREQCIALLCDKKGLEEFKQGYSSGNQCAEGAGTVDETAAFLRSKGISGTPTYIFPDGTFHSGLMGNDELVTRVEKAMERSASGR
ncbi:MAG: DsbC family protein [Desulfacinum sp.]|nr:DsbC family protein [Desulfacinum sp.]